MMKPYRVEVRVKTNAQENRLTEERPGKYLIRTTAQPEKGRANAAVIKLLATHLKVPKMCITIIRGQTSHKKIIQIMAQ